MIRSHTRLLPGAPLWFFATALILGLLWGALPINAQKKDLQPAAPLITYETWSDFRPQGWVLTVPLTSSVSVSDPAGLQPLTAAYRLSLNGGGTWSDWSTTGLTVTGAVSTTQFLTVTGLSLPDSATDNLLQFQIVNSLAVTLTSQAYTVTVDTAPPTSIVTSPVHNQIYRTVSSIAGTAGDATSGVITVSVSIQDTTTGLYWNGTAWGASEAWPDASGTNNWTLSGNLPSWANGRTYVVRSRARDAAGHLETPGAGVSFVIDSLAPPPPIGLAAQPSGWSNSATFTVTWTAPADASGIVAAYYKLDAVPTAPTDGTRVVTNNIITGIAPAGDGIHFLYVWLEDGVGNVDHNQRAAVSLYVDRTAPGAPSNLISLPDGWTNQNAFTETWDNPADLSGIVGAYYKLGSTGPTSPTDGTFVSTTNIITNIAVPGEGRFNIFVWLMDAAGNVNHQNRNVELDAFWYDPTPPTTTVSLNGPLGGGGWYTASVTATFTATDLSSGPAATHYRLDGSTWLTGTQAVITSEGQHTLDYYSTDIAGNRETTRTTNIWLDITPPTTTHTLQGSLGGGGWYTGNVTVTLTVGDAASGPAATFYRIDGGGWVSGTQAVLNVSGTRIVDYYSRDVAGNVETSRTATVLLDRTPPTTSVILTGTEGFSGWHLSPVTVTLAVTDAHSGPLHTFYRINGGAWLTGTTFLLNSDGIYTLDYYSTDVAGNRESTRTTTVRIDTQAPGAPIGLVSLPDGWTNRNAFTETWTSPGDFSGIAGAYYKLGSSGPVSPTDGTFVSTTNIITDIAVPGDGKFTIFVWLVDGAGNADHRNRNVDVDAFWYDATPPNTAFSAQGPSSPAGWYRGPVTVTLSPTDAASGVATTVHRLDGGAWLTPTQFIVTGDGSHTLDYYSTDIAGNQETTRTASIPIDTQPPTTTLQIGSAPGPDGWYTQSVTITFVVTDAGSGPDVTYFRLDGGAWLTGTQYILSAEGQHTLDYYSVDRAGNAESIRSASFKVDRTPPLTAYILDGVMGDESWFRSAVTVTLVPTDAGSGVATTLYRVDGGAWLTGTVFTIASDGVHTVEFYSVDLINNIETTYPLEIKIDTQPPGAPVAIVLTPSTWTPINQFSIQWANPSDLSGIAGAYYKLDAEPTSPTDGIFVPGLNSISGITVTTEGAHPIYLWLKDRAGNVDHLFRNVGPPLRYDATPPTTTITLQGTAGENNWFTSAVTFTLTSTDTMSGVRAIRFAVDGGDWITATSAVLATSGKHTVEYLAEDIAGNVEVTQTATIRIDSEPPSLPVQVITGPIGWSRFNDFYATWESPLDTSGIAGAYYKLGAPPTGPHDGTFITSTGVITGITVPGDGRHDFHIWLRDNAGNTDANRRITVQRAFWYDATPPRTTAIVTGTAGTNGWYISALTVTLSMTDATSGVAATWWQLDGGQWSTGISFTVNSEGPHEGSFFSVDAAGNGENVQHLPLRIDRRPPSVTILPLAAEQPSPNFQVTWAGLDPEPGSGVASYDVQVRDGAGGPWTNWQTGTLADSAVFLGQRGHTYYFRARVRDLASHQSAYPTSEPFVRTTVQAVANGDFGTGNFANWNTAGILVRSVVPISDGPDGGSTLAARLGGPEYGPSIELPGNVPVGAAIISQTINVPALADVPQPRLSFWYRVLTYDVMYSNTYQKYYDTFDVTIRDSQATTATLVLRDGNPTQSYGTLYDTGWRRAMIDLRPYAGRSITLEFANWNREDNRFNTYTYLDNVQVLNWPAARRFLPLAFVARRGAHQSLSPAPETRERAR